MYNFSKFNFGSFLNVPTAQLLAIISSYGDNTHALYKGDTVKLKQFVPINARQKPKITGTVQFMSRNHVPLRSICKLHCNGSSTVWLWSDGQYHRCVM